MLDVERTVKNLMGMTVPEDEKEFRNNIVCAFDSFVLAGPAIVEQTP